MKFIVSIGGFLDAHSGAVAAVATAVIAAFTGVLGLATRRIYKHSAASERAYVKMSHRTGLRWGPGLEIDREHNEVRVVIQVKNSGRTPADVSNTMLYWLVLPKGQCPPAVPNYPPPENAEEPTTAFLVADDSFFYWKTFDGISDDHLEKIAAGDETLWIYGYVDYSDKFMQRHRGGYARVYNPTLDTGPIDTRNNLVFVNQDGYNYDRPRKKGEGRDW